VKQEDSEQNEVDGMKKGADSTSEFIARGPKKISLSIARCVVSVISLL